MHLITFSTFHSNLDLFYFIFVHEGHRKEPLGPSPLHALTSNLWPYLWRKISKNLVSERGVGWGCWCALVYRRPSRQKQGSSGMRICRSIYFVHWLTNIHVLRPYKRRKKKKLCASLLTNLTEYLLFCLSTFRFIHFSIPAWMNSIYPCISICMSIWMFTCIHISTYLVVGIYISISFYQPP